MLFKTETIRDSVPLSLEDMITGTRSMRDKIGIDTDTIDDHCCSRCLSVNMVSPLFVTERGWACVVHGESFRPTHKSQLAGWLQKDFQVYLEELRERIRESEMSENTAITVQHKPSLPMIPDRDEVKTLSNRIMTSMAGIKSTYGKQALAASMALANMAATYQLDPFRGELWIIPTKWQSGEATEWTLYVGYKGMDRASRRQARADNAKFVFGSETVLDVAEIEERGSNACSRCNGSGAIGSAQYAKKCPKCVGEGKFPATDVIAVLVPMYVTTDKAACEEMRIPYNPTWGLGVWQPGDNVIDGRDKRWVAVKRARVDAMNQRWQLPFAYSEQEPEPVMQTDDVPHIEVENPYAEIASLADSSGIKYTNIVYLANLVNIAIEDGYEDEGHVLSTMNLLGIHEFDVSDYDAVKEELDEFLKEGDMAAETHEYDASPTGEQKSNAKKQISSLGYKVGAPQNNLLVALFDDKCTWSNVSAGQMHNAIEYAKRASAATKDGTHPAIPEFGVEEGQYPSVDDYKDTLKEVCKNLDGKKEFWQPMEDQRE